MTALLGLRAYIFNSLGRRFDRAHESTVQAHPASKVHDPHDLKASSPKTFLSALCRKIDACVDCGDRCILSRRETVEAGKRLPVVEAMKMEHALIAPHAGIVHGLTAKVGGQVEMGERVMRVEAARATRAE